MSKVLLKDIADIQSGPFGTQLHKDEYVPNGVFMPNAKNIGNGNIITDSMDFVSEQVCKRLPRYILQSGDILFGRAGSIERHAYVGNDYAGCFQGTNCIRIRCNNPEIARFISYYLWLPEIKQSILNKTGGSVLPYITSDLLKEIEIDMPDEEIALKISNTVGVLDRKIECNNHINDNLWQAISTIYDYWFTQFDFPNAYGKPYRTSGGELVWNDKIKRAIPSGWIVTSIISNPLTQVIKPGVDVFETKEYLATAEVTGTSIASGSIIDYENREGRANMQPVVNSVWFAKMKNSIKHLFLNKEMAPIIDSTILSTGFCGLQCSEKSFEYVASFVSNPRFEIIKDILAHGATQEAVNNDDMESISFVIPSDEILEQYHAATKGMFAQISKNICENRELIKVRDWLLPMLMNGQATIAD